VDHKNNYVGFDSTFKLIARIFKRFAALSSTFKHSYNYFDLAKLFSDIVKFLDTSNRSFRMIYD